MKSLTVVRRHAWLFSAAIFERSRLLSADLCLFAKCRKKNVFNASYVFFLDHPQSHSILILLHRSVCLDCSIVATSEGA
jgi:hypothetical protein